jgi:hypothetical protein
MEMTSPTALRYFLQAQKMDSETASVHLPPKQVSFNDNDSLKRLDAAKSIFIEKVEQIENAEAFTCKETPIENQRPLKVRVVGAGYSGVYLGIRIPQKLRNIDLKIYEKNAGVGGTWWENRYPGCACDIPCE